MPEVSKYGKALESLKDQKDQQPPSGHMAEPQHAAEPVRVRPRSKRSDPAWRPYTLMLKSKTHTEAGIILKRMDTGQDLSDLAQELFEGWLKIHQH